MALYLEESSLFRPIATGDIFRRVRVPGSTDAEAEFDLSMILAHPSAMRKGATLEDRVRAAPVAPVDNLSKTKWAKGHYNVFPLPKLAVIAEGNGFDIEARGWAVLLELAAPVETAGLDLNARVACLAPEGIHLLLQRLVHADTRFPVREDLLATVFSPKLDELDLLETWNEELVAPLIDAGGDLGSELDKAAQEFDDLLSAARTDGSTLRSMLEQADRASEARRLIHAEIRQRRQTS